MSDDPFGGAPFHKILSGIEAPSISRQEFRPLRIAFCGNATIDVLPPLLKYLLRQRGLDAVTRVSDFDQIVQETSNATSGLYKFSPELVVSVIHGPALEPRLYTNGAQFVKQGAAIIADQVVNYYKSIVTNLRTHSAARIIVIDLELNAAPLFGSADASCQGQNWCIRKINREIHELATQHENLFVIDSTQAMLRIGRARSHSRKQWYESRVPYSLDGMKVVAWELCRRMLPMYGRSRKCLVLDCDNTLWGGIVGEDGIDGLQIGETYPGNIFREFQEMVLGLHARGVLLALNSKNNLQDVLDVLERHPGMLLRRSHFAAIQVNWEDKAANLQAIARKLNIGLDAVVFVDDSPVECEYVRKTLPMVEVWQVPADISAYCALFERGGSFETLSLSTEDLERSAAYHAEERRQADVSHFADTDSFLRSLEMEVRIYRIDELGVDRAAQLTQKTNQFNVTTKRYTKGDVTAMMRDPAVEVLGMRVRDKYGDLGMVGLAIVKELPTSAVLDTFLLSCRVIGRRLEKLLLVNCLLLAKRRGSQEIVGHFVPSAKNGVAHDLYKTNGFSHSRDDGSVQIWRRGFDELNPVTDVCKEVIFFEG